jgi:GntR family transcriptional regulator / MocR family aminotransferase
MPGSDFLQLDAARAPAGGLSAWLVDALRAAVTDGRLVPGAALPPTRRLAEDLGVSRGVVVEAYRRLTDEGLLDGRTGAGTVVRTAPAPPAAPHRAPAFTPRLPVPRLLDGVDLYPGLPDVTAFPRAAWLRAERAVLDGSGVAELGYGDPQGHPRLRAELATWLARVRGLRVSAEEIVVVAGVAQALALLAVVLRSRGVDRIGVEDPGSRGATDELAYWGLRPEPVPVDADGLVVDALPAVGAVVVTPAHQFPTGVVLAPGRRRALVDWAARGGLVVEDDYDAEYRYDRLPVAALHPAAPDRIAYTGSVSKSLAPALRLGWLVPPPGLLADVIAAKHAVDLGSPALPQLVLARLIASGDHDRHVRAMRRRHRARRDALLDVVRTGLPAATVLGVAAGLHLTVTFPDAAFDDAEVAAGLRAAGVAVQPLSLHRHAPGPPGFVLGYAAHPPDRLRAAGASLVDHVRRVV